MFALEDRFLHQSINAFKYALMQHFVLMKIVLRKGSWMRGLFGLRLGGVRCFSWNLPVLDCPLAGGAASVWDVVVVVVVIVAVVDGGVIPLLDTCWAIKL